MYEILLSLDNQTLKHHYKPKKGWLNDPNGLVYFKGYYHVFYQHLQNHEAPYSDEFEAMVWGHTRSKDLVHWEELPVALQADMPYDKHGVWSGTAIVKDDILYLFYAGVYQPDRDGPRKETVCMAYSNDGERFYKCDKNPLISEYPSEGGSDFRDPALIEVNGVYYMLVATGNKAESVGRLLLYKSDDLLNWNYQGVLSEWADCRYCECPSFLKWGDKFFIATSIVKKDAIVVENKGIHSTMLYGDFDGKKFNVDFSGCFACGPDQYAGQVFKDDKKRMLMISWISGWHYVEHNTSKCIGCLSTPLEIKVKDGKFYGYPVEEARFLLKDDDPAIKRTKDGFVVERKEFPSVYHKGEIKQLEVIRDEYILEIFVNKGEYVYSIVLC